MPCLRTSFASAEIRAASPTATRRPRLAQPRPPLLAHREISFRKGRNSLCDLLEIRDLQWSFGRTPYRIYTRRKLAGPCTQLHTLSVCLLLGHDHPLRTKHSQS